ncbi:uncharacterized protein LOC143265274 isoform X2 [Megachile rotundata]|uniref:uncharacterized protein LOC143265274 isoform X2 n=1 Tax=Megachile rotundata TaxID=143995 RepID=UPI003FD663EF
MSKSEKSEAKRSDAEPLLPLGIKGMWHDQFKVFQEHGLDKAALAAYESCKMCSTKFFPGFPSCTDTMEESYEELQRDMQAFDKKLNDKKKNNTNAIKKKSPSP